MNHELKRSTDVVSIFPDTDSVIRLVGGALLVEINDEMIASDRRCIAAASVAEIHGIEPDLQSRRAARATDNQQMDRATLLHHALGRNRRARSHDRSDRRGGNRRSALARPRTGTGR